MSTLSAQTQKVLRIAGWYPGRRVPDLVASWKESLLASDAWEMFPVAERVLLEYGGLAVDQDGDGETCAREPFTIDPILACYQKKSFQEFSDQLKTRLYPLGEAVGGHTFLVIDENGSVYYLMHDIRLVGSSIDDALENLSIGRLAERL